MIRLLHIHLPVRTLLLGMSEVVLFCMAFTLATFLRFGRDADLVLTAENGVQKIVVVALTYLLAMYYLDLYDSKILSSQHEVVSRLLEVLGLGTVLLALIYYAVPELRLARGVFIAGMFLALPFLIFWRQLFFWIFRSLGLFQKALIVGRSPLAKVIAEEIHARPELGLELKGYVDTSADGNPLPGLLRLGGFETLPQLVREERIDRVICALSERRGQLPAEELLALKTNGVSVQEATDLYESITGRIALHALHPGNLLFTPGFQVSRSGLLGKRMFCAVFSLVGLSVSLPLQLLIALAIWLDSGGPIIFSQSRVGKDGKLFTLHKFRTMFDGADTNGKNNPAEDDDRRCTRVGKWLRRTRLDELPQLYNILVGDMDFIGPRPFVPDQEEELTRQIPYYRCRWLVKPGATGWAQINRGYCATLEDNLEKLSYDLYYVKNLSLGLDLVILFQTIKILVLGRGAR